MSGIPVATGELMKDKPTTEQGSKSTLNDLLLTESAATQFPTILCEICGKLMSTGICAYWKVDAPVINAHKGCRRLHHHNGDNSEEHY